MSAKKEAKAYTPRLQKLYDEKLKKAIMEQYGIQNELAAPRITKIILNMGMSDATQDRKVVETALKEMALISGQKPVATRAKKSNASFKLREGMEIGCKVTLRRERMYEFLDRLINIALPRVRDFRGVNHKSFDGKGNYAMGIKEQIIFPEIQYDKIDKLRGMDIIICTSAANDDQARELLRGFNMPFQDKKGA